MFRNTFVSGFVSLFFAAGTKPLQIWRVVNAPAPTGTTVSSTESESIVRFVKDEELGSQVLCLFGSFLVSFFHNRICA